jgi:hypothetical protein
LKKTEQAILPNVFQNSFSSTEKAASPKEPQPESFFEEPELYQMDPKYSYGACHVEPIPVVQTYPEIESKHTIKDIVLIPHHHKIDNKEHQQRANRKIKLIELAIYAH